MLNFHEWFELNEQVYGNIVTGYHRTNSKETADIINKDGFILGTGDYGPAVYFSLELDKWLQPDSIRFGEWLIAAKIDVSKFLIYDKEIAKKIHGTEDIYKQIAKLYPQFPVKSYHLGDFNWNKFQESGLNKFVPGVIMNVKLQTWALVFNPKVAQPYKIAYHPSPETPLKWEKLNSADIINRLKNQKDFDTKTWRLSKNYATDFNKKPEWGRLSKDDMPIKIVKMMRKNNINVNRSDLIVDIHNSIVLNKPIVNLDVINHLKQKYPFINYESGKIKIQTPEVSNLKMYDQFFRELGKIIKEGLPTIQQGNFSPDKPSFTQQKGDFTLD